MFQLEKSDFFFDSKSNDRIEECKWWLCGFILHHNQQQINENIWRKSYARFFICFRHFVLVFNLVLLWAFPFMHQKAKSFQWITNFYISNVQTAIFHTIPSYANKNQWTDNINSKHKNNAIPDVRMKCYFA